jgi:hypothetical protein
MLVDFISTKVLFIKVFIVFVTLVQMRILKFFFFFFVVVDFFIEFLMIKMI